FYLGKELGSPDLYFGTFHRATRSQVSRGTAGHNVAASGVMEENKWCHVAVVIDARETRLYFNGTLAGTVPGVSSFPELPADSPAYMGSWNVGASNTARVGFTGEIDEVRVWAVPRTGDEIRAAMFQRLTGREEGLAGLWNFDDPDKPAKEATPNTFDGEIVKSAGVAVESLPSSATDITQWTSLSGATVDGDGPPLG